MAATQTVKSQIRRRPICGSFQKWHVLALCLLVAIAPQQCMGLLLKKSLTSEAPAKMAELNADQREIFCFLKQKVYKYYKLDPVPEKLAGGNKRCAVVSNSGALMKSWHGWDIDSHEVIFRFNDAPTGSDSRNGLYGPHVGNKTTYRLGWNHKINDAPLIKREKFDPNDKNHANLLKGLYPANMGHPWLTEAPTSGFFGMLTALSNCETVDAYEMAPSRWAVGVPYSYYAHTVIKANDNTWHSFAGCEHDLWSRLSVGPDNLRVQNGKTSYPGFASVDCGGQPQALGQIEGKAWQFLLQSTSKNAAISRQDMQSFLANATEAGKFTLEVA